MVDYEELLDAAGAETDLDDFGADDFLEGLQILTRALRTEAQLNALGEAVLRQRIVGYLKQRLQVEDWYRRYPEIDAVVIRAPLIGLGLPRTGSSALSCLLAEDPNARSLLTWEASEPCPPPATVEGPDPRIERARELNRRANLKSHTPMSATGPIECQDLMALDFKAHIFQAFAQIPSYSQWLLEADLTSTYLYERRVLKLLQWKFPEKPWRLKAPTHILYLDYLVRALPDARFVMTHRDPAEVMGIRKIEGFWGHCWQSALFPSGRGFGFIAYPPRPDGSASYNEGYVFEGDGALIPARVVHAPWLSKLQARDQDVTVVLESERGRTTIEGETRVSTFAMGRPEMPPDFPVLQQAGARYRWNGEETYGMIERSSRKDRITR